MKADKSNTGSAGTEPVRAIGVFPGFAETRRAVDALRGAGLQDDQIGVIGPGASSSEEDARAFASELEAGHVVVTVRAPTGELAQRVLDEHGAINRAKEPPETAIPGNALPATPY